MNLNSVSDILYSFRSEILVAVGVLLVVCIVNRILKAKRLPPGPIGLPILGYLPFLTKYPYLKFIKLAEKYGRVFSFYLGSNLVVVLNDAEVIRDAFGKQELLIRPPNSPLTLFGVITPFFSNNYKMWKEQRKFVVQTMKDLGLGKSKIEGHIQDEIQYFLSVLEQSKGLSMDVLIPLTPSMSNNICALVFGERYDYDNPDRLVMDNTLENVSKLLAQTSGIVFFPWLKKVPFFLKLLNYENAVKAFGKMFELVEEKIKQHKETIDSLNVRDFIDGYLLGTNDRIQKDPETTFSAETLKGCVLNLFGAGSETVRTTISWCLYIMAAFPEVQKKVQREIDTVLGSSRFPQFPDQKDMTYTQAVIREMMRWKTIVPLNLLRCAMDDVYVAGHWIPKGTLVLANFWSVHHNPNYWDKPEEFRPDRFLNEDGSLLKTNHFMPFSVGKRSCPGETMALMEVFLYFVAILQRFKVSFPEDYSPDFDAHFGLTYKPKPFKICFTKK